MIFHWIKLVVVVLTLTTSLRGFHATDLDDGPLDDPEVSTAFGKVQGQAAMSRKNRVFYAFRGIPYAKPPIGQRRFKGPQKIEPWSDVLRAKCNPTQCIQKNYLLQSEPDIQGSEDCLYLNVYTPQLPDCKNPTLSFPVLVYFHWDGLVSGNASTGLVGPEYLMDRNIVLVTCNYRVGLFGYLSTGDDESPGNYGLKDQVMVLQWVQETISDFGGDRNKVTIMGAGTGAAQVHLHLFSPLSRGLFHRAIVQSGTALAPWVNPKQDTVLTVAKMQAKFTGCDNVTYSKDVMDCLRCVDATTLLESSDKFKIISGLPMVTFYPSVEACTTKNPQPFLVKTPLESLKKKEFMRVPLIIGFNPGDGIVPAGSLLRQQPVRRALNNKFHDLMPDLLALSRTTPKEKELQVWKQIKEYYLQESEAIVDVGDAKLIQNFIDLFSDRGFLYPIYKTILMHSRSGHKDLWVYNFEYRGENSYADKISIQNQDDTEFNWESSHCNMLLYIFRSPDFFEDLKSKNDLRMIEMITKIWYNFAKYGNPTPPEFAARDGTWPKIDVKTKNFKYLNISGSSNDNDSVSLTVDNDFYRERTAFWETLPQTDTSEEFQHAIA